MGGVRENRLYRNHGGKFEDVTAAAGIGSGLWSEGAAWIDYNRDGLLDLFVVNYVRWTPDFDTYCGDRARNIRSYCHPRLFEGLPNALYRNNGNGTFTDVSDTAGLAVHKGKGMSASVADYDADGFPDIFVANDKVPNFLFHNTGKGRFEEVAFDAGVALPDTGTAVSGMGSDFRDLNNDGAPDILFTALAGETYPMFLNSRRGAFSDAGQRTRLAPLTHEVSGWGMGIVDLDNDGWKDIFTANSHVNDTVESFEAAKYKLHNTVFRNAGDGGFSSATAGAGLDREPPRPHRGAAFADFNRDGKIDVVVTSLGSAPEIWENMSPGKNAWLTLALHGRKSNRNGLGAEIRIGKQHNHATTAVGYLSSSMPAVHFGLGRIDAPQRIEIRWPSGEKQVLEAVKPNQILQVNEP